MSEITQSLWIKPAEPPWCPRCGFTVLDFQQLNNFQDDEHRPFRLPSSQAGVAAGQYTCLKCGYRFVTPAHIIELLYKFARDYGHFPTLVEAPPEYFYAMTSTVMGREVVAIIQEVQDLGAGETGKFRVTIGEGRTAFVPRTGEADRRPSLLESLEKGLDLQVVPRPPGSAFAARDDWGRYIWSQDGRRWLEKKDPPS